MKPLAMPVAAGEPLKRLLKIAYSANVPVLLEGRHGVGKSEILKDAAAALGIDCYIRDLSLMEPPDLVGMPYAEDGRTRFAPPATLPQPGTRGLFVLEELNRCPRYMLAPCLQLLTERRLNDYGLPEGWLPCASINPSGEGYQVEELDGAILSRFMRLRVVASVDEWLAWAGRHGVHERICAFVAATPRVFDDPAANPRSWTFSSKLLRSWEAGEHDEQELTTLLAGTLGNEAWALAFLRFYLGRREPLRPEAVVEEYPTHRAVVRDWVARRQLDMVIATWTLLQRHLRQQFKKIAGDKRRVANVEAFLGDLPAELKTQAAEWLHESGHLGMIHVPRQPVEG